ncbi:TonB-dependent receptor [Sphingomonas morindae]|uniref:TonB-dependent receptor n=1 Tax=Sphingomonas morindae TaxID=1541170 RepID=A0ABY4X7Y3_9SPHN|nr:TonB-dependent receptor [Sphingomonas morindae]USI73022.1 TonB-dependent receptor [Sphingomonas morindae]
MISSIGRRPALFLAGATLLAASHAAQAQDAPAATALSTPAPDGADLGQIVVTAERRSENLQRVPISVGVVNGEGLRTFQAGGDDTLLSLSGRVPGLYVESSTGRIFPRFYIRGLGNIDFYLGASQPVEIIQDDVVLEHVVLKSNPAFDINQVEVLRGPQGTLFGRNTTAGIIKFDSNRPTQSWQGQIQASYGTYNSVNLDAGIGGPLIQDKIAIRASGLYQHRDNWVDNVFAGPSADGTQTPKKNALGGFDEKDARLQILLTPTENLTILASGHARDYSGTSTIFYRGAVVRGTNSVPDGISRAQVALDEGNGNPQAYHTYGGSLNIGWDIGLATLTSISAIETSHGYSRGDTDGGAGANFPVNGVPNGFGESQGRLRGLTQYTQELRLASNGTGPVHWQVGGLYFDSRDDTEFDQRAFFLQGAARNPNNWVLLHDVNTSWAMFGQLSYQLTDRLTLTAGARYSTDDKRTQLLKTADTAAGAVTYRGRRDVSLGTKKPSWDVSALYALTPSINLYGRIAHGFRGPTIQGRSAVFNTDFTTANAETITSYEAGVKTQFFDNRLRFNATGFTYTVHDIQLNGNDEFGNGVLFNADKARAWGMEADAELRPVQNLTLTAGLSLLHSEIDDKRVYAQVCALNGQVVCTVEDPTIKVGANTFAQIDGNPLPNAPRYNVNLTARYDIPLAGETRIFLATDWNIQGYTNFVLYKTKEFTANGNFEGGAKLGLTTGRYEIAAFVRNITNEKNLKGVIENYMAAVYNDPRIIGVSLSAKLR